MRQQRLDENVERVHQNNLKIYEKQAFKSQRVEQSEYERLRDMVTHQRAILAKSKKRVTQMQEYKEHKSVVLSEKLQHKKVRMSELHKQFLEKLNAIERKTEEKDQILTNIKNSLGHYNSQKREISLIKKQDQETNLERNQRMQTAYKRLLVDKLQEKNERLRSMQIKRDRIQLY